MFHIKINSFSKFYLKMILFPTRIDNLPDVAKLKMNIFLAVLILGFLINISKTETFPIDPKTISKLKRKIVLDH